MKKPDGIRVHDECADEYDQQLQACWPGPEALFEMSLEYLNPGERLLDVGIGTGLGSLPFAEADLEIFGIDGSVEMLKICESKNIASDLKHFDLQSTPFPYIDGFFDHVISCGVFHFFKDLEPMFNEICRIIKTGGIFAFTIKAQPNEEEKITNPNSDDYSETLSEGIMIFMHSKRFIEKLLQSSGFDKLKESKFIVHNAEDGSDDLFSAYAARRCQDL